MRQEYILMDSFQKLVNSNDAKNNRCIQENNPTQMTTLQIITLQYIMVESKKRDVFASDLIGYFNVKPSSVSSLIGYLEKGGFILRAPMPDDHRRLRLLVTKKGWANEEWIMKAVHDSIVNGFAGFTEEEMNTLLALMDKLNRNFTSIAETGLPYYHGVDDSYIPGENQ